MVQTRFLLPGWWCPDVWWLCERTTRVHRPGCMDTLPEDVRWADIMHIMNGA